MNYRHVFHAGGFADVFKHAVLCRILHYLHAKPAAFRVIDTHAGEGLYDLTSAESRRGKEWHDGVEKLLAAVLPDTCTILLKPYLDAIAALNRPGDLSVYPGSPAIIRSCLRPQDRLTACELQPKAAATLARNFQRDKRIKILAINGWEALEAHVPPPERRGVILIDPAFESENDFRLLHEALSVAHRKWAGGIYVLWYPIKARNEPEAFIKRLRRLDIAKILRAELIVSPLSDHRRLNGSGLIIVNPPWLLKNELKIILPALVQVLGRENSHFTLNWIVGEGGRGDALTVGSE